METESVRNVILETLEASLEAQLKAIRKLRQQPPTPKRKRGRSQMDFVFDVLSEAGQPLHIKEIVSGIELREGIKVDIDSLGSALTKRVVKGERFIRTDKNTFDIKGDEDAG